MTSTSTPAVVATLAIAHLLPSPNGARLASLERWGDAPESDLEGLLGTPWVQGLEAYASSRMGDFLTSARCLVCNTDAPTTFAALTVWIRRNTAGAVVWEQGANNRWLCLGCGKHSHAPHTALLSAHAALAVLGATQQRAPAHFQNTFVESDTYVRS
jgi:hypothetical protein